ncbi:MAG TPA: PAS domain S-box protein [Burkholderiaceae bacterium]
MPKDRGHAARWLVPAFLILLFLSILLWLPWQAQRMETNERQEQLIADTLWVEQAIRFQLGSNEENLHLIASEIADGRLSGALLRERLSSLVRNNRELKRIVWLDADSQVLASTDDAPGPADKLLTAKLVAELHSPLNRSARYTQPAATGGAGTAATQMDYLVPIFKGGRYAGGIVASYRLDNLLDQLVPWWFAHDNEITLSDSDDNLLARRIAGGPGRGVYTHTHPLELPGVSLILHTNSTKSAPKLLPNLLVGSVILLSLGLLWSLWALWRDISRRLAAEGALRKEANFRKAMENSLSTGLRARDLDGRVTYVNPAFCEMVGMTAEELIGRAPPMPYWAPELMEESNERFAKVLTGQATPQFETVFVRPDGERFAVLVFETPLVDDSGRQTGWMGSILDISDRKRIEELNRQQQEKLQASARLASMGEIASTLAHELNQPLAAISSYTAGALNVVNRSEAGELDVAALKPALEKANVQAQRAGQIIRSVHTFVKKRESVRELVDLKRIVDGVIPLIELQARQFYVTVQTSIAPALPPVSADRMLLEQVLFNLTRNAIEAMQDVPAERRLLRVEVRHDAAAQNIVCAVIDQGHGVSREAAENLFSPFFSTKAEGMGMGLKICRSAVEFHGGSLNHADNPEGGTIFTFALPVAQDYRTQ